MRKPAPCWKTHRKGLIQTNWLMSGSDYLVTLALSAASCCSTQHAVPHRKWPLDHPDLPPEGEIP